MAVFGADHVWRMDIRQMADFHHERQADVTVSTLRVPLAQMSAFRIIDADQTRYTASPGDVVVKPRRRVGSCVCDTLGSGGTGYGE